MCGEGENYGNPPQKKPFKFLSKTWLKSFFFKRETHEHPKFNTWKQTFYPLLAASSAYFVSDQAMSHSVTQSHY